VNKEVSGISKLCKDDSRIAPNDLKPSERETG
jgi:hypothetical protein